MDPYAGLPTSERLARIKADVDREAAEAEEAKLRQIQLAIRGNRQQRRAQEARARRKK